MSLSTASLHSKNPFFIRKSRPRKALSRSPFKLFAESVSNELGSYCQTIDLRIGNQRMILDTTRGYWILEEPDEIAFDASNLAELKRTKHILAKENNILHDKLNILLEMLAEITAEETLQATLNR